MTRHQSSPIFLFLLGFVFGLAVTDFSEGLWAADGEFIPRGNPAAGLRLALDQCSSCHDVGAGDLGDERLRPGPAFTEIARRPDRSVEWFRYWLTNPHPYDPVTSFLQSEIDHLSAYYGTLTDSVPVDDSDVGPSDLELSDPTSSDLKDEDLGADDFGDVDVDIPQRQSEGGTAADTIPFELP